jgi:hypothetical protein
MFASQGLEFDESLPVLEDWDVLMQAVLWCGVVDSGEVTALWRRWRIGDSSTSVHTQKEWDHARMAIIAKLDSKPLLLPPRSLSALHADKERADEFRGEVARLQDELNRGFHYLAHLEVALAGAQRELETMRSSSSWKASKPIRLLGSAARRASRRQATVKPD